MTKINKLFNELSSIEFKYHDMIENFYYELLKKCEEYQIKEVKIPTLSFYQLLTTYLKPPFNDKIRVQIRPDKFRGYLSDCFVFICQENLEVNLSLLRCESFCLRDLKTAIEDEIFARETDPYKNYEDFDKKKLHFDGKTIVITDPCYCIKQEEPSIPDLNKTYPCISSYNIIRNWREENLDLPRILEHHRETRRYVEDLKNHDEKYRVEKKTNEDLGIVNYIDNDTFYGDWGCTVFREENNEVLGEFCADSGRVGVYDLSEILIHNPDFREWASEHPWCATIIKDFSGDVWMEIEKTSLEDGSIDYSVHVIGKGNVNFKSFQTSL